MKRLFVLALFALCFCSVPGRADELDDQYLQVFGLIQEADKLSANLPNQAMAKYLQAQAILEKFQQTDPKWNATVVSFRLSYVSSQIASLSPKAQMPPSARGETNAPVTQPAATAPKSTRVTTPPPPLTTPNPLRISPAPVKPAPAAEYEQQLKDLKEQVRLLREDKGLLEAKLKEALAMQPAAVDPRELAKAEEKLKSLQMENDLLKASVDREKTKPMLIPDMRALDQAQQALAEQKEQNSKLALERDALQARLKTLSMQGDANSQIGTENQLLKKQLSDLQASSRTMKADADTAAALRAENQLIKKELAGIQASAAANSNKVSESARQLAEAQAQVAALQSDREILMIEKNAVEERYKQMSIARASTAVATATSSADAGRIRGLERDRDGLQKKLEAANKELYARKSKGASARVGELENQLTAVRSRLAVFEAQTIPYSTEELALLRLADTRVTPANPNARKKSLREMPAGSARLVAEAQTYFSSKQFDKAEAAYEKVVKQDKKSIFALANLAAIQVEAKHYDAAEATVKQALALDPEDAYTLYIQGLLKFQQSKFDEALISLSHSAILDPDNPEVQNYLGMALAEKGMRGPAETAFRKAVELQPDYARAHYNLAVFYATQKPPYVALAKWHYQKALAGGAPSNLDLEKMFRENK
jgi:Flp pilus assembly protein TadD